MRLLEKLQTLVEEEDKEYEPINKHKLDTRATTMRTSSGRSKTFKKRDGKTRKGQFLETQQRKKHQQIKNKRERFIRGRKMKKEMLLRRETTTSWLTPWPTCSSFSSTFY